MDFWEEFNKSINKIRKIFEDCNYNMKEVLRRIDIEQEFDTVMLQISEFKITLDKDLSKDLLEELINLEKWNVLEGQLHRIGMDAVCTVFNAHKDENEEKYIKFKEIVYKKLGELSRYSVFEDVKDIIIEGRENTSIKKGMPTLIKNFEVYDRIELIGFFEQYSELYNTEEYLEELLQVRNYGSRELSSSRSSIILRKLRSEEKVDKVKLLKALQKNIDGIIENYKGENIYDEIDFFEEVSLLLEQVPKDMRDVQQYSDLIKNAVSKNAMRNLRNCNYNIELMEIFRKIGIDTSEFAKNQNEIIANLSGGDLIQYMQQSKQEEGFHQQWNSKQLVRHIFKNEKSISDETTKTMLSTIISELCEQANIKPTDIILAGEGKYSMALKIGNYILKIGEQRKADRIINDKRIIRPLIRQQTNPTSIDEKKDDIPNLFIEVQQMVEAKWYEGLSEEQIEEELYKIYAELRDRNILWTDCKKENVGRLLAPNDGKFSINGQELKSENEAIQAYGQETDEILQPGELVIIDTDFIFSKDLTKKYPEARKSYHREFEKRYQEEKQKISLKEVTGIVEKSNYTLEEYAER